MTTTQPESTRSVDTSLPRGPGSAGRSPEPASRPPRPRPASGPVTPVGHRTVRAGVPRRSDRVPAAPERTGHLVRRAAQGDEAAWHAVVEQYSGLLESVVREHGLTGAQAADAVQTTWLRLLEDPAPMRRPEALAGWLRRTARRICREAGTGHAPEPYRLAQAPDRPDTDPEAHVLREERADLVRRAVRELPEPDQHLLELLVARPPLSPEEVGARLGMPVEDLGPTRDRLLARLRTALASADL